MGHPKLEVKLKVLDERARQFIPKYQSKLASGFDLHCLEDVVLQPGETKLIKTGLAIQAPAGYEIQVRPRSGLSLKTFFSVANTPGTVDADYSGDLSVIGYNKAFYPLNAQVSFKAGDRIAQAVLVPVVQAIFVEDELEVTERGDKGFGSSGI